MTMPQQLQKTALSRLTQDLVSEFERDSEGSGIAALLSGYADESDDWQKLALFDKRHYMRNLVYRNDDFELLLLCWGAGQTSPIHNHMGQNCWMTVLDGAVEEVQFRPSLARDGGPLEQGKQRTFRPGNVAYITDDIALHLVRPIEGRGGVSLHLYSEPIDHCHVFDETTGEVVMRALGYHSIQGRLTGA